MNSYLTVADVLAAPFEPPDARVAYGPDPAQFADLRLPSGPGPHPIVIVIHGGCYLAAYDLSTTHALAEALRREGMATWNVEYRRLGIAGGGWPGTFLDVAAAVDRLRDVALARRLDLDRVAILGHSAGGHLALWAAARHRIPRESGLFAASPLAVRTAVILAGIVDLRRFLPLQHTSCNGAVVTALLGADASGAGRVRRGDGGSAMAERYRAASPADMLPLGVPHVLITGRHDEIVPASYVSAYAAAARAAGDEVEEIVVDAAAHYDVIVPGSIAWPAVKSAVARGCALRGTRR